MEATCRTLGTTAHSFPILNYQYLDLNDKCEIQALTLLKIILLILLHFIVFCFQVLLVTLITALLAYPNPYSR